MAGEGSEHHEKKPTEDPEPTPGLPRSLHSDVEDGSPSERSSEAKGSGKALTWETLQPLGPRRKRNSSEYVRRKMAEKARPAAETSANRPTDQATKESSSSERRSAFANSLKRNSKSNGSSMLSYIGGGAKQETSSGVLSFEALYAKLLVYCNDIDIEPSCEGLLALIRQAGIMLSDRRIALSMNRVREHRGNLSDLLSLDEFREIIRPNLRFMVKVINESLVVPDFQTFSNDLSALAQLAAPDLGGKNADYIPPLRDADPDRWGVAVCTTDGQLFTHGDTDDYFSIQSSSKPITYALAIKERSEEFVHKWVGKEPSGQPFNAIICLPDNRPHNCCVNVGAIMTCAVLASGHPKKSPQQMVEHLMETWSELCGKIGEVLFDHETMQAEKSTASNNFALAWFIKARRGLPDGVSLETATDFYFSCCSIKATCRMMSVVAATLANGGVCPLTSKEVFSAEIVSKVLSQMQACGMYDASGEFLFDIGLPGKSGVSGIVITVVPNVMGVACFSPRLDSFGNSVRGVKFNQMLVNCFSLHVYDNLSAMHSGCKKDPRLSQNTAADMELANLRFAIQHGEQAALDFRRLLLEAMACATLVDGDPTDEEVATMIEAYEGIMYVNVTHEEARKMLDDIAITEEEVVEKLKQQNPDLDDIQREIILEAVFAAATADGVMNQKEVDILARIANALHVPPAVVELKLFEWRDILAREALEPVMEGERPKMDRQPSHAAIELLAKGKADDDTAASAVRIAFEAELDLHERSHVSRTRAKHRSQMRRAELARSSFDGWSGFAPADQASMSRTSARNSLDYQ